MKNTSTNKSFFNKIWNKFKNHLMINFKTDESDQRQEVIKYVNQAFEANNQRKWTIYKKVSSPY